MNISYHGQLTLPADVDPTGEQISLVTRSALLVAVWEARSDFISDHAVIDRRSVYRLLGSVDDLVSALPASVRESLYGDTTEYDRWPSAPARLRRWGVFSVQLPTEDSAVVIARLNVGHREHLERYIMAFDAQKWQVRRVELYGITWYGRQVVVPSSLASQRLNMNVRFSGASGLSSKALERSPRSPG